MIVEKDTEPLNQGNVVVIENTAGKQVVDNATQGIAQHNDNDKKSTHGNDADTNNASQKTNDGAVAAETTDFDPLK